MNRVARLFKMWDERRGRSTPPVTPSPAGMAASTVAGPSVTASTVPGTSGG